MIRLRRHAAARLADAVLMVAQANLFGGLKPAAMFAVSVHAVRALLAISPRGALLQYVPEVRPPPPPPPCPPSSSPASA